MNNKFEDITSSKYSAKHEFNKLVQTLTMSTKDHRNQYYTDSNGDEEGEESDNHSNSSSFDEETSNMNQKNLKQILQNISQKQKEISMSQGAQNNPNYIKSGRKVPDKT